MKQKLKNITGSRQKQRLTLRLEKRVLFTQKKLFTDLPLSVQSVKSASDALDADFGLHHPALAETVKGAVTYDDVVQHLDPHQFARLAEPARDFQILRARRRISGRMVVQKDHRRGRFAHRHVEHLARVHDALTSCTI